MTFVYIHDRIKHGDSTTLIPLGGRKMKKLLSVVMVLTFCVCMFTFHAGAEESKSKINWDEYSLEELFEIQEELTAKIREKSSVGTEPVEDQEDSSAASEPEAADQEDILPETQEQEDAEQEKTENTWLELFKNEYYDEAFPMIQEAAEEGDPEAVAAMAHCYVNGYGTEKDEQKGFELARQAAEAGNAFGMDVYGLCFTMGAGTARDVNKAFEWYQKAADAGSARGLVHLGLCYWNGFGVEKNIPKALEFLQQADEAGDCAGALNLGTYYEEDKRDYKKALEWYQKAAEAGSRIAMCQVGRFYQNGYVVRQDYSTALEWFGKSAEKGYQPAIDSIQDAVRKNIVTADAAAKWLK